MLRAKKGEVFVRTYLDWRVIPNEFTFFDRTSEDFYLLSALDCEVDDCIG